MAVVLGLGALALPTGGCAQAGQKGPGGGPDEGVSCDGPCANTCASDADCRTGLHCETKQGLCVPCVDDSHCPAGQVCAMPSHNCAKGCSMAHPECGDAGICDPNSKACVQCFKDSDCADPANPRCDANQHLCFPCLPQNDNCAMGSYCAQSGQNYTCAAGCKDDSDCGGLAPDAGTSDGGISDGGMPGGHCVQNKCSDCKIDTDCPLGKICKAGACSDGCSNIQGCPAMFACCAAKCVDTTLDYQNCGMCGKVCSNGNNCCNSACSNPSNDVMNCNGCGMACMTPNGVPACMLRQCTIASCNPGWNDCNGNIKDGCETNTDSNVNNCGACNNPCALPNASPKCVGGMCQIAGCNFGYGDCDMMAKNGCETPTATDINNCGTCGMKCQLPHATPKCNLGNCQVAACDPGFVDCDNNPQNGCEVDITGDVNNCGGCNKACSSQNGVASCVASTCQIKCNPGFGDCDGNVANGCETNTASDVNHCGSCNSMCGLPQNVAVAGCGNGTCSIVACQSGYFDIDKNANNGCECLSDSVGPTCNGATGLMPLNLGDTTSATGNLVPSGKENWFQVTFKGNGSLNYHPHVKLSTNPGNAFLFDLFSNCAGSTVGCGKEGGTANGRTDWEVSYSGPNPAADPNNPGFKAIPEVGNAGTVYIRVYRANGAPVSCDNFVLSVTNN